ncbi:Superoxide dismutase [Fe] [Smittium culicis]|uniref:Superoxide dismutase [Fe] n=1 Tax=Smittium culicis TaxID=133412 RepID=A0A1R1YP79_9FUNG|nr:Superoxide dismutase [Fe] [Smittium culicis]
MNRFSTLSRAIPKSTSRIYNLTKFNSKKIHTVAPIPYLVENGLKPLYSSETLDRLYNVRQKMLLEKVDEYAKDTEFDDKTLKEIITITSSYPEHAALYNYASQAWNFDFFLQNLTDRPHEPNMILRKALSLHFGSFEGFKNIFTMHAKGIFGNGWTWLAVDRDGNYFIKNTYNGGFLSTGTKEILKITTKFEEGRNRVPINQVTTLFPILCLNMWTDSYLADFGYNRDAYIEAFWKVVNWDLISQKIHRKEI